MNIVLLNPPGKHLYIRDYYCSKIAKGDYVYQPPDLVYQSGYFREHSVVVVDAIAENLSLKKTLERIKSPDAIIFLTGAVSFEEDISFLRLVKQKYPDVMFIGSGDVLMEGGEQILKENPLIDAIMLDFTSPDVLYYVEGKPFYNMIAQTKDGPVRQPNKKHPVEIPVPQHELFPLEYYRYPFVKKPLFATILTDYGCPHKCRFCIMSQLSYKFRRVDNVKKELDYLKSLGITELYIDDQTFGIDKKRTLQLLNVLKGFGWTCFTRVDTVNEDLLRRMKQSGCHTVMFGVESGNQKVLDSVSKGITLQKIESTFALCKKIGLRTVGTFLLGLPQDNKQSIQETISFSKKIDCDFAAFNVAVPRSKTKLKKIAKKYGLLEGDSLVLDQSTRPRMKTKYLDVGYIRRMRRKAIIQFYFRPKYISRRICEIRSWYDVANVLRNIVGLARNVFR